MIVVVFIITNRERAHIAHILNNRIYLNTLPLQRIIFFRTFFTRSTCIIIRRGYITVRMVVAVFSALRFDPFSVFSIL